MINFSLNRLYVFLGVSKQAINKQLNRQKHFDQKLTDLIIEVNILRSEHPGCGVEKMYYTLNPIFLGRDKFVNIFMELGYQVVFPKNYTKTTQPVHSKYENLISGLLTTRINQVIQTDITYFQVGRDYYYIIFLIDVYSKLIVGYEVSNHMRAEANLKAFKQVIKLRGKENLKNLIHHSDRGSQYIASLYVGSLLDLNCHISMGQSAQSNAYAERINGIIKNEFLKHWKINTFTTLKKKLKKAVNYYNQKRPHNHLPNRMSPVEFEKILLNSPMENQHLELIYAEQNFHPRPHGRSLKVFIETTTTTNFGLFCPLLAA